MKHFLVTGGRPAAEAISAAIWRVCLGPGSAAETACAIGWRETLGGVLLDFPEDFQVRLINLNEAGAVLALIAPATEPAERNALAAELLRLAGRSVPLLELLPLSVQAGLIETADLIALGYGPVDDGGPR